MGTCSNSACDEFVNEAVAKYCSRTCEYIDGLVQARKRITTLEEDRAGFLRERQQLREILHIDMARTDATTPADFDLQPSLVDAAKHLQERVAELEKYKSMVNDEITKMKEYQISCSEKQHAKKDKRIAEQELAFNIVKQARDDLATEVISQRERIVGLCVLRPSMGGRAWAYWRNVPALPRGW